MSLREDIGYIIKGAPITLYDEAADMIINKILDAAVLNIRAVGGPSDPMDSLDLGYDEGIIVAVEAINKLRPEK